MAKQKQWRGIILTIAAVAVALIFLVLGIQNTLSSIQKHGTAIDGTGLEILGQMGDFFGGVLNPLIAFMALLWLIHSVSIQKEEMTASKEALQESVLIAALTATLSYLNEVIPPLEDNIRTARMAWEEECAEWDNSTTHGENGPMDRKEFLELEASKRARLKEWKARRERILLRLDEVIAPTRNKDLK